MDAYSHGMTMAKQQAASIDLGYIGQATKKHSAFDLLVQAVSEAREVGARLEGLSSRLVGPVPEGPANASEASGIGLIDGVEHSANAIQNILSEMRESIARIERRL